MNKLIIAAAGAGKTTFLIREALRSSPSERVLITTYTDANEKEIRNKFLECNKCVPGNVTVQTWFSFLLQHGVRPFQKYLIKDRINGLNFVQSQSGTYKDLTGKIRYYAEANSKYYVDRDNRIYSDKLSKFVIRCNSESNNALFDRVSRIYTSIFVDEVQDLAGFDLEILANFLKFVPRNIFVGDPRQVTYLTHHEKKHTKYTKGKIKEFIEENCKMEVCQIDESTLNNSHRNNPQICQFSSKIFPEYPACDSVQNEITGHDGIFFVRKKHLSNYLANFQPVQLRNDKRVCVSGDYPAMNFGAAKGLGFNRVLIYPTAPILKYLRDGVLFNSKKVKGRVVNNSPTFDRAKFYVAVTRARHSVAIVIDDSCEMNSENIPEYTPK